MKKHEILVYILDDTYGKYLNEEEMSKNFEDDLNEEFSQTFDIVNIGPGADVPAFAAIIEFISENWELLLGGSRVIYKNLIVRQKYRNPIRELSDKMKRYFSRPNVVLNRDGALILAINAVSDDFKTTEDLIEEIKIQKYYWVDKRFPNENGFSTSGEKIQKGPPIDLLSFTIHRFILRLNSREYDVTVDGKNVSYREI